MGYLNAATGTVVYWSGKKHKDVAGEPQGIRNFYIDQTGGDDDDTGLSADHAWKTIAKINAQTFAAGDWFCFKRGETWNENLVIYYQQNGTVENPIVFTSYGSGAKPIIDGTGLAIADKGGLIDITRSNNITIDGIDIQNAEATGKAGIYTVYGDYLTVRNSVVYNTNTSGIGVYYSDNVTITRNDLSYACVGGSEETISIAAGSGYAEVSYNVIHDAAPEAYAACPGGQGINFKDGAHDCICHHNLVRDNIKYAMGVDAWTSHTYNIYFYDNIVYDSLHGYILESEEGGLAENLWVYNCIAYNMTGVALYIPGTWGTAIGHKKDCYFINNTVYGATTGGWVNDADIENIVYRNNLFSNCGNDPQLTIIEGALANVVVDHNLYDTPNTTVGTNAATGDPLFVSEVSHDFHIQFGSPAIDAGSATDAPDDDYDGVNRLQDGVYDIGAYEYT